MYLDRGISKEIIIPPKQQPTPEQQKINERYATHNADAYFMFNMIADLGTHVYRYTEYDLIPFLYYI